MRVAFKSLVAAAAFIVAGAASATIVTVAAGDAYKGSKLSGSENLVLSPDMLALLDVFSATVAPVAPGVTNVTRDPDNFFVALGATSPITTLSIDDTTNGVVSTTASGGLTLTAIVRRNVSTGGSLTVSDLSVDPVNMRVYATISGSNGVGPLTHFYLWDIRSITGSTALALPAAGSGTSAISKFTASGLVLTADGLSKVETALGLGALGKTALRAVSDFGTVDVSMAAEPAAIPLSSCSVIYKVEKTASQNVFSASVKIANDSHNAVSGWKVSWKYGAPTLALNVKNAKISDTNSTNFTALPVDANTAIAADGSTSFSFRGFSKKAAPPAISDLTATVGGQACQVTTQ